MTQFRHFCNCFMTMMLSFASHKQSIDDELAAQTRFLSICGQRKCVNEIEATINLRLIVQSVFLRLNGLFTFSYLCFDLCVCAFFFALKYLKIFLHWADNCVFFFRFFSFLLWFIGSRTCLSRYEFVCACDKLKHTQFIVYFWISNTVNFFFSFVLVTLWTQPLSDTHTFIITFILVHTFTHTNYTRNKFLSILFLFVAASVNAFVRFGVRRKE